MGRADRSVRDNGAARESTLQSKFSETPQDALFAPEATAADAEGLTHSTNRRSRAIVLDLSVSNDLAPNPDHPLAALPARERQQAFIRDIAQVLAAIARRQAAMRPLHPSEDQ
jgi:hypothetical protein